MLETETPVSISQNSLWKCESYFGRGDLFNFQSIVQQLCRGEVLLHKVLQDLDPHVWVVNLSKEKAISFNWIKSGLFS